MDPFLRDLLLDTTPSDLADFYERSTRRRVPAGVTLCAPGDVPQALALVASGRIGVDREGVRIAEFGPGSYFGETALVADVPSEVRVVSLEPTELVEFPRARSRDFMEERPQFAAAVLRTLMVGNAARQSATNSGLVEARTLAHTLQQRNAELQESLQKLAATQEELLAARHLASLGTLVAGVAHEINNPLGYLVQSLATAQERLSTKGALDLTRIQRALTRAQEGAERIRNIVEDVRGMGRPGRVTSGVADPSAEAELAVRMLEEKAIRKGVGVTLGEASSSPVVLSGPRLGQILVNLVSNAIDATPPGGRVTVAVATTGTVVEVRVTDTGPGVGTQIAGRIFDPFFTTKPVGHGSGLGLWVCRSIVVSAGGSLELEQPGTGGATFVVRLPIQSTSRIAKK